MDPPRADAAEAPFLRTLAAIRTRCAQVHDLAEKGALQYFDYHPARRDAVIAFCASIMQVCLGSFLPPPVQLTRVIRGTLRMRLIPYVQPLHP